MSAHLRETEDDSRLPFHPACPVCRRDRLAGSLDGDELLSAGLGGDRHRSPCLRDRRRAGGRRVTARRGHRGHCGGGRRGSERRLDLAGRNSSYRRGAGRPGTSAPSADLDEDAGPLEQEPTTDIREPSLEADPRWSNRPPTPRRLRIPTRRRPRQTTPAAPSVAPAESELQEPRADAGPRPEGGHRREVPAKEAVEDATQTRLEPSIAPGPASAATEPAPAAEIGARARAGNRGGDSGGGPGARGDDAHHTRGRPHHSGPSGPADRYRVVRPGESLWSIAADLLGDRATVPRTPVR